MPERLVSLPKVSKEETDAIICALRYWQAEDCPDFHGLATQDGLRDQLDESETDDLIEHLNCSVADDKVAARVKADLLGAIDDARKALVEGASIQAAGFNEGRLSVMKKKRDESGISRTAYERAAKDLIRKQTSARNELVKMLKRAQKAGVLGTGLTC